MRISALAGTGLAMGLSSCKEKYKPVAIGVNDKINIGLVGCSQRGIDQVWKGVQHLEEYHMAAICDVIDEKLDWAEAKIAGPVKRYRDYREMVMDAEVDLVIVATPLKWHYQVAKAAIEAGKHVVCEKMMVYSIEEAIELEKLASAHDKMFKVSYEARNNPAYMIAKELVGKGALGEIIHADCTWNRSSSWRRTVKDPDKVIEFPTGERISQERLLNWRMSMEFGGGLMGEILSHQLDAVEWILDSGHLLSASGSGNIAFWKDGRSSFDNIHANLVYDNNLIIGCNSILSNALENYTISIYGRKATIKLGLSDGKLIPEAVKDESLKEEVDAITGASYKLIKKEPDRKLKEPEWNAVRSYYADRVSGYVLDTLTGYKRLAGAMKEGGTSPVPVTSGKHSSIAVHLTNKALHEDGVHEWKPEYGS